MFDDPTPPVMRGDLFALLDPDPSAEALTPERISEAAQALARRVARGERAPGDAVVMDCLDQLVGLAAAAAAAADDDDDAGRAWPTLDRIRRRLSARSAAESRAPLPWRRTRERVIVLPQRRSASLVRAMPIGEGYFAMIREATPASRPPRADLGDGERPDTDDAALGPPALVPPVDVAFRLFRFGEAASDIRLAMHIGQEAGTYREVLCAGGGDRFAVLCGAVMGVFNQSGQAIMSGRVPGDKERAPGAEVTAIALEGDMLALNMRADAGRPVEMALLNIAERRGLPIGTVGEDASALALGDRCAFVVDGLNLVRVPLFDSGAEVRVLRLRPWFAEYPWRPRKLIAWGAGRLWVCNGDKIVLFDNGLDRVLGEVVLPQRVVDMSVRDAELCLVTYDPNHSVARITCYDLR